MTQLRVEYGTSSKAVLYGVIGGIIGSVLMIGPKALNNIQLGMPYNINWIVFGILAGANKTNAFPVGLGMHIMTGIIVGAIFGLVVWKIKPLNIYKNLYRGIIFGIATGVIVFGIFFIPMLQNVLAPNLIKLMAQMNPSISVSMIKQNMQKKLPTVIQSSFAMHILFGGVLGTITQILLSKSKISYKQY
jgi:hypothetical protein